MLWPIQTRKTNTEPENVSTVNLLLCLTVTCVLFLDSQRRPLSFRPPQQSHAPLMRNQRELIQVTKSNQYSEEQAVSIPPGSLPGAHWLRGLSWPPSRQMEAHQHSPDSSSEECTVLEAPPDKNSCPQHAGKVRTQPLTAWLHSHLPASPVTIRWLNKRLGKPVKKES